MLTLLAILLILIALSQILVGRALSQINYKLGTLLLSEHDNAEQLFGMLGEITNLLRKGQ